MNQQLRIAITAIITFLLIPMAIIAQEQEESIIKNFEDENLEWVNCPEFMPESCRIAVLQGNPAEPNTDLFFKLQGNTSVPTHWHHSAERMVLVSGKMRIDYEGEEPAVIKQGEYAYGPPELPHSAACESSKPCVLFIGFNKPVDSFEK